MWQMKWTLLLALTRTKKSMQYLSSLDELYCQTGLYLDLLAIPCSSKEHSRPRLNVRHVCSFNNWIDAWSCWHLSLTDDTPLSGWNAISICLKQYSYITSAAQFAKPLALVDWPGVLKILTGGLNWSWIPLIWQLSVLNFKIMPKTWNISSAVMVYHKHPAQLLPLRFLDAYALEFAMICLMSSCETTSNPTGL